MVIAKKKIKKRYVVLLFAFLIILAEFLKSEYISREIDKLRFGDEVSGGIWRVLKDGEPADPIECAKVICKEYY